MISSEFHILRDILNDPSMLTTSVSELVVAERVYRNFPIVFPNKVTHVELVELDMVDFDDILGMH